MAGTVPYDLFDEATSNHRLNKAKLGKLIKTLLTSFGGPHARADATNVSAVADATSLATAYALANDLKAKYNAHRVLLPVHYAADATNVVAAADADDEAKTVTLVNELKADINAHKALATTTGHYQADGRNATITTADCTDTATAIVLVNEVKALYHAHIAATFNVAATFTSDFGT